MREWKRREREEANDMAGYDKRERERGNERNRKRVGKERGIEMERDRERGMKHTRCLLATRRVQA